MANRSSVLTLEKVFRFFDDPPPAHLPRELAVCFVAEVIRTQDSYPTEMKAKLAQLSNYQVSDTVLYEAISFLDGEGCLLSYPKRLGGRGRPRRMCRANPNRRDRVETLARLWREHTGINTEDAQAS